MARRNPPKSSGRTILVIDDNEEVLTSTARLLSRDGHTVSTASNGPDGLAMLRARTVDLVLVDYFMPAMNGEQVIEELRTFDPLVQVVLQTGYATECPPRDMLQRLDIQGYHDKSEGPDKLRLWIDVALKAAMRVQALHKSRLGLQYILSATPQLHRIQPLEDLLQGVLLQTAGLLGAVDSFVAVAGASSFGNGFVALADEGDLRICAATGRFAKGVRLSECLEGQPLASLGEALQSGTIPASSGVTILPLRVGEVTLGAIYLDRALAREDDADLLTIFANQAAVAVHNATLYDFAAVDPLTRTYTRRFFEQALVRELRLASRSAQPLAVIMVDMDDLRVLNNEGGHLCGDRALETVGRLLKAGTRATDLVGRWGGDEFVVVLPSTDAAGAAIVTERLVRMSAQLEVSAGERRFAVRVSIGSTVLAGTQDDHVPRSQQDYDKAALALIARADAALYAAKRAAKGNAHAGPTEGWPSPTPDTERRPAAGGNGFGFPLLDRP